MSHRRAVMLMVLVTLLWSMAGVVSRHLEGARSFEVLARKNVFRLKAEMNTFPKFFYFYD